jgi:hypothetical protein
MNATLRCCVVLCVIALAAGTVPTLAFQSAPAVQAAVQADQRPTQIRGELLRVDTKARTLTIKGGDGSKVDFRYTDQTEVTGADKGVAGLATMNGVQVTVHYKVEQPGPQQEDPQPIRTATKIEVHARQ